MPAGDDQPAPASAGSPSSKTPASGASGAAGAGNTADFVAGSGGAAGPPAATRPPPDPNITFNWRETQPTGGECKAGTYTGTFSCNYLMAGFDPNDPFSYVEITGPVAITLTKSQNGEFLEIADGKLEGIALLLFGFRVKLSGQLDCGTKQLAAMAIDGVYGFGDPSVLALGTGGGTLSGALDVQTATLDGSWKLDIVDGAGAGSSCAGNWTAVFTP